MISDSAVLYPQTVQQAPSMESFHELYEIRELIRLADGLPDECRPDFYKVLDRLVECLERRQRVLGYLHDSLNQMSLDLKYLIFDLEATRRERDECRYLLEMNDRG